MVHLYFIFTESASARVTYDALAHAIATASLAGRVPARHLHRSASVDTGLRRASVQHRTEQGLVPASVLLRAANEAVPRGQMASTGVIDALTDRNYEQAMAEADGKKWLYLRLQVFTITGFCRSDDAS
jgi:hypothetical protein